MLSTGQVELQAAISNPRRFSEREYAVRFALSAISEEDRELLGPTDTRYTVPTCIAFGYASSVYEVGRHGLSLPIMVSTCAQEGTLNVTFYTNDAEHESTGHPLPQLEQLAYVLPAPRSGAVLGLCFSADKSFLAIRQLSGTSIVMLSCGQTSRDIPHRSMALEHVVTLPRTNTGGHEHADVAFHPRNRHQLGLVDTHGNWSIWQLHGRRAHTSRILYKIKLHASGKLVPSERNLKHFGNNSNFDGWHRICCLDRSPGVGALLICSRRIARTFDFDGSFRGDVDMRLGRAASWNWVLDVQSSLYHPGVCFVLTSTHLQIMRLASAVKKADDLDLLCSWPHYRGESSMSLSLHIVDTPQGEPLLELDELL